MLQGLRDWRISLWVVIGCSLGAAALADFLFFDHALGINCACFAAGLLGMLLVRRGARRSVVAAIIIALATVGLVWAMVQQPTWLNIMFAVVNIGTLAMTRRNGWTSSVGAWVRRWWRLIVLAGLRPLRDGWLASRWMSRHPHASMRAARIVRLWLIPIGLSAIFVALFTMANPLVERWLSRLVNSLAKLMENLDQVLIPQRVVVWLVAAGGTYAFLRARAARVKARSIETIPMSTPAVAMLYPAVGTVVRCLTLFNLIFAAQTTMDFTYLYGHRTLPEGLTYMQYAHRGSYPLIATALLAAVFVLVTFRQESEIVRSRAARGLVYLWILQNVVLTVSAAQRLHLYVSVYSLTRLRVAAAIWMFLVAAGLVWIVMKILLHRTNAWLLGVNTATAAIVLYVCCFINFSCFIADYDARHGAEFAGAGSVPIDLEYFRSLGPEALPALARVAPRLTGDRAKTEARVDNELRQDLEVESDDWRAWTWRRDALHAWAIAHPPAAGASGATTRPSPVRPTRTARSGYASRSSWRW